MKPKQTAPTTPNRRDEVLADFATLRIPVTADQLDAALKQAQDSGLSHLDFLQRLLADQAGLRRERSLQRRIKEACFREQKPLAEFDWNFNPAISRVQMETLAACDFVRRCQNLVFVGQSGVGKSHLIQSIGQAACTLGFKVHYLTSGKLLEEVRPRALKEVKTALLLEAISAREKLEVSNQELEKRIEELAKGAGQPAAKAANRPTFPA